VNCKQRRKFRRRWKYAARTIDYSQWWEIYDWCVERFGKGNFETTQYEFLFDIEDKLILFHLKWGHCLTENKRGI
jgi:hypothetical protein